MGAVRGAVRSFLAEPRPAQAAAPLRRDWALVAALLGAALLEAVLRDDVAWPAVALVAGAGPAICLPWRRTHPVVVTAAVFGSIVVGDAAAQAGTGEPIELYAQLYVLLLPYALFRWGSAIEAVSGTAIVLAALGLLTAISADVSDLAVGPLLLSLPAALGAAMRYRAGSRLREADQVRLRERVQLARELHDTVAHHCRPSRSAPRPDARSPRRDRAPRSTRSRSSRRPPRARSPSCARWSGRCGTGRMRTSRPSAALPTSSGSPTPRPTDPASMCSWPATSTTCDRCSAPRSTASRRSRSRTRSDTRVTPLASTCASPATVTACA
jgi:hypothetical protein